MNENETKKNYIESQSSNSKIFLYSLAGKDDEYSAGYRTVSSTNTAFSIPSEKQIAIPNVSWIDDSKPLIVNLNNY